jgi:crotonobetainyl-CoA:carnitine CoA-transferase CaiB-like acyl-CoA transferase
MRTSGGGTVVQLLAGKLVLDITQVMAGPFCCIPHADMGAEAIKAEPLDCGAGAELPQSRRGINQQLLAAGVPGVPILDYGEAVVSEQAIAREMV